MNIQCGIFLTSFILLSRATRSQVLKNNLLLLYLFRFFLEKELHNYKMIMNIVIQIYQWFRARLAQW